METLTEKYKYLEDRDFLKAIEEQILQTHYVRIKVLNMAETEVLAAIEGIVTSGSISVNGSSAIRKTGSLSMVATEVNGQPINAITSIDNLISIEKRIQIEIGLQNNLAHWTQYDVIWFPQGTFVITSASITKNNSGVNISIQFKDKMALLSGDVGGTLPSAMVHAPEIVEDYLGNYAKNNVLFKNLITTLVYEWGGIPKTKIHIKDIPDRIENTVRWVGGYEVALKNGALAPRTDEEENIFSFGDNIGYQKVDFTYPVEKELSSNAGDSITSVLDKVKNSLGNFEYFFDDDGEFYFQEIQNYKHEGSAEQNLEKAIEGAGQDYLETSDASKEIYHDFRRPNLITAYTNNPQYSMIKNDISVWGIRGDSKAPIYYHLVIDHKPTFEPKAYTVEFYQDALGVTRARAPITEDVAVEVTPSDWRTDIYFKAILGDENIEYGKELKEYWPTIYNIEKGWFKVNDEDDEIAVKRHLNSMTYFFDIIDPKVLDKNGNVTEESMLKDMLVSNIGRRRKAINDNNINCLFSPSFPDHFYIAAGASNTAELRKEAIQEGHSIIQVEPAMARDIAIGSAFNSAYDAMRAQLHEMISYNETVSITTLPLYHLKPNVRVTIDDDDTGIHGDYMIKSYSIPLTYNGTMTIQCTKAIEMI